MLASFSNSPFIPHTPPRDTLDDLAWWIHQLSRASISSPILKPQPLLERNTYSDASSGVGVAITIGSWWCAWRLTPGWKSQGRDIQWAKAIGFELLVTCLCDLTSKGEHIVVYGDNRGVVEGWWKRCSANRPTNLVFQRIIQLSESHCRTIHTHYVPSAQNPADPLPMVSTPPAPSSSTLSLSLSRPDLSLSMFDIGELAKKAVVNRLVRTQNLGIDATKSKQ